MPLIWVRTSTMCFTMNIILYYTYVCWTSCIQCMKCHKRQESRIVLLLAKSTIVILNSHHERAPDFQIFSKIYGKSTQSLGGCMCARVCVCVCVCVWQPMDQYHCSSWPIWSLTYNSIMMSNINHASILLIEQFKVMFSFYKSHCATFLIPLQLLYVVKMKLIRFVCFSFNSIPL